MRQRHRCPRAHRSLPATPTPHPQVLLAIQPQQLSSDATLFTGEAWFDPIEAGPRGRVRGFIEDPIEQELAVALGRGRYERLDAETLPAGEPNQIAPPAADHRHGHRSRQIMGSFGAVEIAVPRAHMVTPEGVTVEWRSEALPRYAQRTRHVKALIAGAYLAGTNTRRVRRALAALFAGAVSKTSSAAPGARLKTTGTPGASARSQMRI